MFKTMTTALCVACLVAVTFMACPSAHAALISVSSDAVTGGNAASVNAEIVPAALEGPLGGLNTTWNILSAYSGTDLLDSTGATTPVDIAIGASERRGVTGAIGLEVARTFYQHFSKGADTPVTISGLTPGAIYNVALVSVSNADFSTEGAAGTWSTTNATSSPIAQILDGRTRNVTTFVDGQNYVMFENVVVDGNGEMNFLGDAADKDEAFFGNTAYRLQLNGVQIQEVPEPASLALLGLGGLMLCRRK